MDVPPGNREVKLIVFHSFRFTTRLSRASSRVYEAAAELRESKTRRVNGSLIILRKLLVLSPDEITCAFV